MMPAISVIIATFNKLPLLKLCLSSLERQAFKDFEVIIADDGSGPEVEDWIGTYNAPFPVTHLWQENKGFRKCKLLNHSLVHSKGEYVVFIDADCIVARDFLMIHWQRRKAGVFLGGRRVMIKKEFTANITREMIDKGYFDSFNLWGLYRSMVKDFKYYEETVKPLFFFKKRRYLDFVGSNFSAFKSDLFKVNGFDEEYEHRGGGEDTDIAWRLDSIGCRFESVRCLAIQFHLGHEIPEDKSISADMFFDKKRRIKSPEDAKKIKSSLIAISDENYIVIKKG
jgi:glycosyltransferase involved in cell wall biosynthesis